MTKAPIDIKRDSGGFVHIGTLEECAVKTAVEINDSLFIIKENAIYAVQLADQIDPERTNIALPNIVPRPVLLEGSDSELVGKTLLTAMSLFKKRKFLQNEFDHEKALSLSFEALTSMIAMRAGATEFEAAQQKAHEKAVDTSSGGGSPHIPAMGDGYEPVQGFHAASFSCPRLSPCHSPVVLPGHQQKTEEGADGTLG